MRNILRITFWLALAFAVTMAVLPHPPRLPGEPSDKFQHILAFATLAVLAALGWPALSRLRIGLGLLAVGAGIEVVQMIPVLNRDAELLDLLADGSAVAAVLVLTSIAMGLSHKLR